MFQSLSALKFIVDATRGAHDQIKSADIQPYVEAAAAETANRYDGENVDPAGLQELLVVTLESERLADHVRELEERGKPLRTAGGPLAEELRTRDAANLDIDWNAVADTFLKAVEREISAEANDEVSGRLRTAYDQAVHDAVVAPSRERARDDLRNGLHEFATTTIADDITHTVLPLKCSRSFEEYTDPGNEDDPNLMAEGRTITTGDTGIYMILGEAGAGKTWFAKRLTARLHEDFREGTHEFLPMYVDLSTEFPESGLDRGELRAAAIERYLPAEYSVSPDQVADFLPDTGDIVWILDGYDEAVINQKPGSKNRVLELLLSLADGGSRVMILGRTSLFEDQKSLQRAIRSAGLTTERWEGHSPSDVRTLFVKPLDRKQIRRFISEEYAETDEDLLEGVKRYYDLEDLARRPVLLPIICDTVDDLKREGTDPPVSAGRLYELYTHKWLDIENDRYPISERNARRLVRRLALYFHREGITRIDDRDLRSFCMGVSGVSFVDEQFSQFERRLRSASFLTSDAGGGWRFLHRSFLEYFLAERIKEAITRGETGFNIERFPSKETDRFVVELLVNDSGWEQNLLSLADEAEDPIFRYLCVWLASRAVDEPEADIVRDSLRDLRPLIESEDSQFVVREILVTLESHDLEIDEDVLREHAEQSVPRDKLLRELEGYYGSLYDARTYQKSRIAEDPEKPPKLFYLLNLEPVARPEDEAFLKSVAENGTRLERMVARRTLKKVRNRTPDER